MNRRTALLCSLGLFGLGAVPKRPKPKLSPLPTWNDDVLEPIAGPGRRFQAGDVLWFSATGAMGVISVLRERGPTVLEARWIWEPSRPLTAVDWLQSTTVGTRRRRP